VEAERDTIRNAFVDAYPRYVASVLAARGVEVDNVVADAIIEGVAVLDGLLTTLGATAPADQTASPLELFREALRPIDRVLALRGASQPPPGSGATRIAPWDRYALSPGSSQVLGERAREAHIAWGLEKAQAVARYVDSTRGPAVGLLCPIDDRALLVAEAEALGYRTIVMPAEAEITVAIVCAEERDAPDVVRDLSQRVRVVVYGRSIDDLDQVRFASLGATAVVPAQALFGRIDEYIPLIG
jgi:hypothetical protein